MAFPLTKNELVEGILSGNRVILSRAITLVESSKQEHQQLANEVVQACLPESGNSIRIGITGVPGVGKSTFIESFGNSLITDHAKKLAVLAIDPSSEITKGSILGDKTRMETLVNNESAFIRPTASSGSLGGVANRTREAIILCEAAGFDTIFVETVGVGQSETAVRQLVDVFLLLMLAGAGDELQGIKKGIMEMADILVINKADGNNMTASKQAAQEYRRALHLFPPHPSGWVAKVLTCSALHADGLPGIWEAISSYQNHNSTKGYWQEQRKEQLRFWLKDNIQQKLLAQFYQKPAVQNTLKDIEQQVVDGKLSIDEAMQQLFTD